MDLFKSSIEQIVYRISYVISTTLPNEIMFVLATEKIAFMQTIIDKFSQKLDNIDGNLEEQAAMMSLVYQLYNHLQIDAFELFFALNNRFEYENLWRFDMNVENHLFYEPFIHVILGKVRHFKGQSTQPTSVRGSFFIFRRFKRLAL